MTGGDDELDEQALQSTAKIDPPPPAPALLSRVAEMKPVRTRSRLGGFLLVLAVGVGGPALAVLRVPLRPDLGALPLALVVAAAALWAAALVATLAAALVPLRGDVLPSASRAATFAAAAAAALLAFSSVATVSVPGVSLGLADVHRTLLGSSLDCGRFVLCAALLVVGAGYLVLRRVLPVGGGKIGLALGAAGGAAGGLALVFVCPLAVTAHVLLGHVGGTIVAAAVGAALLSRLLGR
jgi:hypothetical protein